MGEQLKKIIGEILKYYDESSEILESSYKNFLKSTIIKYLRYELFSEEGIENDYDKLWENMNDLITFFNCNTLPCMHDDIDSLFGCLFELYNKNYAKEDNNTTFGFLIESMKFLIDNKEIQGADFILNDIKYSDRGNQILTNIRDITNNDNRYDR